MVKSRANPIVGRTHAFPEDKHVRVHAATIAGDGTGIADIVDRRLNTKGVNKEVMLWWIDRCSKSL